MAARVTAVSVKPRNVEVVSAAKRAEQPADDGEQESERETTKEQRAHRGVALRWDRGSGRGGREYRTSRRAPRQLRGSQGAAVRRRRRAEFRAKGFVEVRHISKAGRERHIDDLGGLGFQTNRGTAQPRAQQQLVRRRAREVLEGAQIGEGAQSRGGSQAVEARVHRRVQLDGADLFGDAPYYCSRWRAARDQAT